MLTSVIIITLVKVNQSEGFHLDVEDYLMGLLQLVSELVGFALETLTIISLNLQFYLQF